MGAFGFTSVNVISFVSAPGKVIRNRHEESVVRSSQSSSRVMPSRICFRLGPHRQEVSRAGRPPRARDLEVTGALVREVSHEVLLNPALRRSRCLPRWRMFAEGQDIVIRNRRR